MGLWEILRRGDLPNVPDSPRSISRCAGQLGQVLGGVEGHRLYTLAWMAAIRSDSFGFLYRHFVAEAPRRTSHSDIPHADEAVLRAADEAVVPYIQLQLCDGSARALEIPLVGFKLQVSLGRPEAHGAILPGRDGLSKRRSSHHSGDCTSMRSIDDPHHSGTTAGLLLVRKSASCALPDSDRTVSPTCDGEVACQSDSGGT
mmetsp:Transcript_16380/g.29091  ORF Transcript_16380/g.29091 Transcript_16380/m.29091 type:complete len:201 (+) Transcript_16380:234-836(+)